MFAIAFALILQVQSAQTVTVVTGWPVQRVEVMRVDKAERLLRRTRDPKLRAALGLALGTRPDDLSVEDQMFKHDFERFRWQRQPLQGPIP